MATTPLSQAVLAGMDPNIYGSLQRMQTGQQLSEQGMDSSPTTKLGAVARLAQALSGSYVSNGATSDLAKTIAGGKKSYADSLAAQLAQSPGAVPSAAPAVAQVAQPAATPNKIYSNDEPSPLDPPSGTDRAKMVATILGEAGNEPQFGKDAVASVIRTRAVDGGYGGNTPSAVVTAPNQFEPWNTAEGRARMERAAADPKQAAAAEAAIASAYGEGGKAPNDPTEGMTHFYSPTAQAALGRSAPAWAGGESVKIGGHVFNSPDDPAAIPSAAQPAQGYAIPGQPTPQAGALDVNHLLALMQHPYADDASKALLSKLLVQKLTPAEVPAGFEKSPDGSGLRPIAGGPASPEYLRKKTEVGESPEFKEITNPDGSKRAVWIDAKNQTVTPVAGQAPPSPTAGLQGPELLDELKRSDPGLHSQVQAVLENRAPYPTGSRLNPQQQRLKELVTTADPNFNAQEYAARGKLLSSFRAGKDADEIKALNTVSGHLNDLSKASTELGNTNYPMVNSAVNWYRENTGDARMNRFGTALHGVVDELSKAYRGGVISDAEARGWSENINAAKSPEQLHGVIGQMADMLQSKIQASKQKYEGMGDHAPPLQTVNAHAQEAFDRLPKLYDEIRARGRGEKPMADTGASAKAAGTADAPIAISSQAEYDALPSGKSYIAPDGSPRTKK